MFTVLPKLQGSGGAWGDLVGPGGLGISNKQWRLSLRLQTRGHSEGRSRTPAGWLRARDPVISGVGAWQGFLQQCPVSHTHPTGLACSAVLQRGSHSLKTCLRPTLCGKSALARLLPGAPLISQPSLAQLLHCWGDSKSHQGRRG